MQNILDGLVRGRGGNFGKGKEGEVDKDIVGEDSQNSSQIKVIDQEMEAVNENNGQNRVGNENIRQNEDREMPGRNDNGKKSVENSTEHLNKVQIADDNDYSQEMDLDCLNINDEGDKGYKIKNRNVKIDPNKVKIEFACWKEGDDRNFLQNVEGSFKDSVGHNERISGVGTRNIKSEMRIEDLKRIESKDVVAISVKGIDLIKRNVGFNIDSGLIDFDVGNDGLEKKYHNVNVASRKSQNLVGNSPMRDIEKIDLEDKTFKSSENYDRISVGLSSGNISDNKEIIDNVQAKRSKYLEVIKRRSFKHNEDTKSSSSDIKDVLTTNEINNSIEKDKINAKRLETEKKDLNIDTKDKDSIGRSVTVMKHKNIHRSLDKNMEQLKYLYFQDAENFWNRSKYQNNTRNKDESINIKNNDIDIVVPSNTHTINELVDNLKDCNITQTCKDLSNVKIEETVQKSTSSKRKSNSVEETANSETTLKINDNIDQSSNEEIDRTIVKDKNNEDFETNQPHNYSIDEDFKDKDKNVSINNKNSFGTYHKLVGNNINNVASTSNTVDKENVTFNVYTHINKVVKIDDGKCIRSTMLLKKLDLSKKLHLN